MRLLGSVVLFHALARTKKSTKDETDYGETRSLELNSFSSGTTRNYTLAG